MKRWIAPLVGLMIASAVAVPVFAQSQTTDTAPQPADVMPGRGFGMGGGMMVCSTSNPTDTVAQALGITAADLRLALVSGKTVSQLATEKNIDVQTIEDALVAQHKANLDQALKDGLITQAQYDAITTAMQNAPAANGNARFGLHVPAYNVVNQEAAAAAALGISCADLVKAQQSGSAIAQIATDKGVDVQTVIDAVTKAYSDALAADVKEGLITQAEADGRLSHISLQVGQWVYDTHPGHGFGMDDMMGGFGQHGDQNGMNGPMGGPGQHGDQNGMNGQMGGPGQRGDHNGMNGFGMPNGPQGFGQPAAPEATVVPNS